MKYDFKREQKEFYRPVKKSMIVQVPTMNYLSDLWRIKPENLKTMIRIPIKRKVTNDNNQ